jgi:hypothetical protein
MLSLHHNQYAVLYTTCLALLTYLQSSRNISAALEQFHQAASLFASRGPTLSYAQEYLHQARTRLLQYHMMHSHIWRPAIARDELLESISLYPHNTTFLMAYAANEERFRIDERVRSIIRDNQMKGKHDTIVRWLFAVWAEKSRGIEFGSTVHSVRSVYERAVESTR